MKKKILIYGAVARPTHDYIAPGPRDWKDHVKLLRDRLVWLANSAAFLDSRNYDLPYSTNVGDIAIVEATRNQLRRAWSDPVFDNRNWGDLRTINPDVLDRDYAAVVVAGSGYFQFPRIGTIAPRVLDDAELLTRATIPLLFYGAGVNIPLDQANGDVLAAISSEDKRLLTRYLNRASLIGVRSMFSRELLSRLTIRPIRLISDPALFLTESGSSAPASKNRVAEQLRVGLNFAFHGVSVSTLLQRNLPLYIALLMGVQRRWNCTFHYFIHQHSEWVIPALLRDKGLQVETIAGDPYYLVERYRNMDVHLGSMLHSCILATGAGTPSVFLAYDVKHAGFAESVGMRKYCHSAINFDQKAVRASLDLLLVERESLRTQLGSRLNALWQAQQHFISECAALLPTSVGLPQATMDLS